MKHAKTENNIYFDENEIDESLDENFGIDQKN